MQKGVGPQNVALTQYFTLNPVCRTSLPKCHTIIRVFHQHVTNYGEEKASSFGGGLSDSKTGLARPPEMKTG